MALIAGLLLHLRVVFAIAALIAKLTVDVVLLTLFGTGSQVNN
jgi:hypothetical protein